MPSDFMSFGDSLLQPRVSSITTKPTTLGGGGSPNNGFDVQAILKMLSGQSDQANADSMKQYKNLLKTVANTRGQVEGVLGDLGKSGMADIAQNEKNQMGKTASDAVSRGLGNTSILNNLQQGVSYNAQRSRTDLNSQLAAQKAGLEMNLGQMQGDAILSRHNQPPDMSQFLSLLQLLGKTGNGSTMTGVTNLGGH